MVEYAKSQGIYTIVTDYLQPEESRAKLLADEYPYLFQRWKKRFWLSVL